MIFKYYKEYRVQITLWSARELALGLYIDYNIFVNATLMLYNFMVTEIKILFSIKSACHHLTPVSNRSVFS